jgi:hypothetical protein
MNVKTGLIEVSMDFGAASLNLGVSKITAVDKLELKIEKEG